MTYHIFYRASLLTMVFAKRGEVFAPGDLPKEKEQWKSQCKDAIYEWNSLQDKVTKLQEELNQCKEEAKHLKTYDVKIFDLLKEVETHSVPHDLTDKISNLQGTFVKKYKDMEEGKTFAGVLFS